jgi:hypothetical protein
MKYISYILLLIILPLTLWFLHQPERPATISSLPFDLTVINTPGYTSGTISLNWFKAPAENAGDSYSIMRSESPNGPFTEISNFVTSSEHLASKIRQFTDTLASEGRAYYYKVAAKTATGNLESSVVGPIQSQAVSAPPDTTPRAEEILFPPTQLSAFDTRNDGGHSITLEWKISPNDVPKSLKFNGYEIYRSARPDMPFTLVGDATGGESDYSRHVKTFTDGNDVDNGKAYYYYVVAKFDGQIAKSNVVGPIQASIQYFHMGRLISVLLLGILVGMILFYINQAKAGKDLFIRKIAGLEAVDEAVGRATEMGKKVFYVPGTQDMDNVQTIAGLTILSRVAKLTAEYETKLEVPVSRSLVMVTAREIVKESYLNAGRPDFYNDDMVYYLTDDQFGYAAAIDGMVVRQKPATIFYQGAFYAESLILAETGNSIGAIQIAGTAMPAQLPFFVAACDYTLIGEELFAASAYLSREPKLLGSLKGQDIGGKLVFLSLSIIFIIIVSVAVFTNPALVEQVGRIFSVN